MSDGAFILHLSDSLQFHHSSVNITFISISRRWINAKHWVYLRSLGYLSLSPPNANIHFSQAYVNWYMTALNPNIKVNNSNYFTYFFQPK